MKKYSMFTKLVAILLAILMVGLSIGQTQAAVTNTAPTITYNPTQPGPNLIWCFVAVIGVIFVGMGGCAMKKLIDKLPPSPPPPPPPPATNAPPTIPPQTNITIMPSGFKMNNLVTINTNTPSVFVPTSGTNCDGMISWSLRHVNLINTSNGLPYIRVITSSILASTNAASTNWNVVGSRMIWMNDFVPNGGSLVVYYNAQGQWREQEYTPYSSATFQPSETKNPLGTDDLGIPLLPDEVGYGYKERFFKLASPTNYIGVLTNGVGY